MTIVRQDTFTRGNVSSGWGTATDGNTWTSQAGSGGYNVTSNEGVLTGASTASYFNTLGAALSGADGNALVRFSPLVSTTNDTAGVFLRFSNTNNYYLARWNASTGQIQFFKKVAGASTTVGSYTISVSVGAKWWLRFQVQGSNISIRTWLDGASEPTSWNYTTTDVSLTTAGSCGIYGFAGTSGDNVQFDSFSVDDLSGVTGGATIVSHGRLWDGAGVGALLSHGGMSASGIQIVIGGATIISHARLVDGAGTASLLSHGGLSANGNAGNTAGATITSHSRLVAGGGAAALRSRGNMTAAGSVIVTGAASLISHGRMTDGGGAAALRSRGSASAAGVQIVTGGATFVSHGRMTDGGGAAALRSHGGMSVSLTAAGTGIGDLVVTTRSQAWSGGPPGSPGTETDVTYTDSSNSGWAVGLIPSYGGMPISSWYEVDSGVVGGNQTSLATSTPDGHVHWLEQSSGSVFAGSEDKAFTLVELAPTGTAFRRYYQCSFGPDANGFNWVGYACIYPGDPGFIAYRFDITNPSGSAITFNNSGAAAMDVALIGGLEQTDGAWIPTNGGYGTVGGANTVGWPSTSTGGDPDYVYISPVASKGVSLGQLTVRQKAFSALSPAWSTPNFLYLQNTSRLKFTVQGGMTSFPASTTSTAYFLNVLRRNLTSSDVAAIAADYLAPGTPTATVGSYTGFSYDERVYVFAAANNALTAALDLSPAHVTARYKPLYKITGWTAAAAPTLIWGGATLVAGKDYRFYNDTTNQILYIQLYFDVVASGAGIGQRNNAALSVAVVVTAGASIVSHGRMVHGAGSAAILSHASESASGYQTIYAPVVMMRGSGRIIVGAGAADVLSHGKMTAAGVQVVTGAATIISHGRLDVGGGLASITSHGGMAGSGSSSGPTAIAGNVALSDSALMRVVLADQSRAAVVVGA